MRLISDGAQPLAGYRADYPSGASWKCLDSRRPENQCQSRINQGIELK
jgi:hypothetical protein